MDKIEIRPDFGVHRQQSFLSRVTLQLTPGSDSIVVNTMPRTGDGYFDMRHRYSEVLLSFDRFAVLAEEAIQLLPEMRRLAQEFGPYNTVTRHYDELLIRTGILRGVFIVDCAIDPLVYDETSVEDLQKTIEQFRRIVAKHRNPTSEALPSTAFPPAAGKPMPQSLDGAAANAAGLAGRLSPPNQLPSDPALERWVVEIERTAADMRNKGGQGAWGLSEQCAAALLCCRPDWLPPGITVLGAISMLDGVWLKAAIEADRRLR